MKIEPKILKVYVAGAYSDNNVMGVLKNIGRGEYYAAKLFKMGFAPFCPWHDKDFVIKNWKKKLPVEMFYNYSIEWLKVSDCVFVVPNHHGLKNWLNSKGTSEEIMLATRELNIPVFFNLPDLLKYRNSLNHE